MQISATNTSTGATGKISFDKNGDRLLNLNIRRYDPQSGTLVISITCLMQSTALLLTQVLINTYVITINL